MKALLLVFDYTSVPQVEVLAFVDSRQEVVNYFVPVLGTMLLVVRQDQDSSSVTEFLHRRFPSMMFTVLPVDRAAANGRMPSRFWDLVHDPRSSGKWEATVPAPARPERVNLRPVPSDAR